MKYYLLFELVGKTFIGKLYCYFQKLGFIPVIATKYLNLTLDFEVGQLQNLIAE